MSLEVLCTSSSCSLCSLRYGNQGSVWFTIQLIYYMVHKELKPPTFIIGVCVLKGCATLPNKG